MHTDALLLNVECTVGGIREGVLLYTVWRNTPHPSALASERKSLIVPDAAAFYLVQQPRDGILF